MLFVQLHTMPYRKIKIKKSVVKSSERNARDNGLIKSAAMDSNATMLSAY